jgi:cytidine deaminase
MVRRFALSRWRWPRLFLKARGVSEGARGFIRIAVIADSDRPIPPCGACRQVIFELCGREMEVVMAKLDGQFELRKASELLPAPFDRTFL